MKDVVLYITGGGNELRLSAVLPQELTLDEKSLNLLERNEFSILLPMTREARVPGAPLQYDIRGRMVFSQHIAKEGFLPGHAMVLLKNLIDGLIELPEQGLTPDCLVLELQHLYLSGEMNAALPYIPVSPRAQTIGEGELGRFFRALVEAVVESRGETDYYRTLLLWLDKNPFTLQGFRRVAVTGRRLPSPDRPGSRRVETIQAEPPAPKPQTWAPRMEREPVPQAYFVHRGQRVPVAHTPFLIGKASADYLIEEATVSRRHATLLLEDGDYYIRDEGSRNSTYIDGVKLPGQCRRRLHSGTVIRLAREELVFYQEGS